jgi:hypothetical protein
VLYVIFYCWLYFWISFRQFWRHGIYTTFPINLKIDKAGGSKLYFLIFLVSFSTGIKLKWMVYHYKLKSDGDISQVNHIQNSTLKNNCHFRDMIPSHLVQHCRLMALSIIGYFRYFPNSNWTQTMLKKRKYIIKCTWRISEITFIGYTKSQKNWKTK